MYAIECARNGSSYGLLVSSNSLLNLSLTIHKLLEHVKYLLEKNNRQYYTFLMNTLSITKLNNFEKTINIYVLCSSCSESIWLSSEYKQFNIPLVSINDIIQAFDRNFMANYTFDLRSILLNMISIDKNQTDDDDGDGNTLVLKHSNSLLLQQWNEINDNHRTWWGLQMINKNDDENELSSISELKEGKFGIAAGYTNEKFS